MRMILVTFAAALCLAACRPALAGGSCNTKACAGLPSCCADCGCQAKCRRVVCQVVCGYKEVEKTCWSCKCEEYCLPIPKLCNNCCNSCNSGCGTCSATADCGCNCSCCSSNKCQTNVQAGSLRVKKKLMKRTVKVKVPVYKCEVRYLCGGCEAEAAEAAPQETKSATNAAPLPPAPKHALSFIPLPRI